MKKGFLNQKIIHERKKNNENNETHVTTRSKNSNVINCKDKEHDKELGQEGVANSSGSWAKRGFLSSNTKSRASSQKKSSQTKDDNDTSLQSTTCYIDKAGSKVKSDDSKRTILDSNKKESSLSKTRSKQISEETSTATATTKIIIEKELTSRINTISSKRKTTAWKKGFLNTCSKKQDHPKKKKDFKKQNRSHQSTSSLFLSFEKNDENDIDMDLDTISKNNEEPRRNRSPLITELDNDDFDDNDNKHHISISNNENRESVTPKKFGTAKTINGNTNSSTSSFLILPINVNLRHNDTLGNDYETTHNEDEFFLKETSSKLLAPKIQNEKRLETKEMAHRHSHTTTKCSEQSISPKLDDISKVDGIQKVSKQPLSPTSKLTLHVELSMLLSRIEKGRKKYKRKSYESNSKSQDSVESNSQSSCKKAICNFLHEFVPTSSCIDESHDHTLTNSSIINLHLIMDYLLETIANYAKDKSIRYEYIQMNDITLSAFLDVTKTKESLSLLQPCIYLSIMVLSHSPKHSWNILFDKMKDAAAVCRNDDVSDDTIVEKKRRKLQLLGISILIKLVACISLHSLHHMELSSLKKTDQNDFQETSLNFLLTVLPIVMHGLPVIIQLLQDSKEKKRTIYHILSVDAFMYTLECSALLCVLHKCDTEQEDLYTMPNLIFNLMPSMKSVFQMQMEWLKNNDKRNDNQSSHALSTIRNNSRHDCCKLMMKQCTFAVLKDWISSVDRANQFYQQSKLEEYGHYINQEVEMDGGGLEYLLLHELAGDIIDISSSQVSLGGIAQSLASDNESFINVETEVSVILQILQVVLHLMSLENDGQVSNNIATIKQVNYLRGLSSFFGKKKNIMTIFEEESVHQEVMSVCITMLRTKCQRSLEIVLSFLNVIWSKTDGLPEEILNLDESKGVDEVPESFTSLIQELDRVYSTNSSNLEPSERAICALLERFILHRPNFLLKSFLSRIKNTKCKVQVLVSLQQNSRQDGILPCDLTEKIEFILLKLLHSSKYLQQLASATPSIFSHLPTNVLIQKLAELLQSNDISDYAKSAVSKVLSETIVTNSPLCSAVVVNTLLTSLQCTGNHNNRETPKTILKYAASWRRAFLHRSDCDDGAFTSFLIAISKAMFMDPANSSIFELFCSAIGDGSDLDDGTSFGASRERIRRCTDALIRQAVNTLTDYESNEICSESMFMRLSPLLMLRRVPMVYYQLWFDNKNLDVILCNSLADIVAFKLGIEHDEKICMVQSVEERKLFAELAARCLPFSKQPFYIENIPTTFTRYCVPVFSDTSSKLVTRTMSSDDWKRVKLALYICCHCTQLCIRRISPLDLEASIRFALEMILNDEFDDDNFIELQTGCIDFLATCVQILCSKYVHGQEENVPKVGIVEEIQNCVKGNILASRTFPGLLTSLAELKDAMLNISRNIQMSSIPKPSFLLDFMNKRKYYSISSRICILNSFTLASQRCSDEELRSLSKFVIPHILKWVFGGDVDTETRHPLCIASLMQILFTILTRSRSFDCLESDEECLEDTVRHTYRYTIKLLNPPRTKSLAKVGLAAISTMRIAVFKVLLAIINVDQSPASRISLNEILAPGEIAHMSSVVRGAANVDEDVDVRKIAAQLSTLFQNSYYITGNKMRQ